MHFVPRIEMACRHHRHGSSAFSAPGSNSLFLVLQFLQVGLGPLQLAHTPFVPASSSAPALTPAQHPPHQQQQFARQRLISAMPGESHSPPVVITEALLRYAQEMYDYTLTLWDGAQQSAEERGVDVRKLSQQQARTDSQRTRRSIPPG